MNLLLEGSMWLNKNHLNVLAIFVMSIIFGILNISIYADEFTPTPSWAWKSHPSKVAIEALEHYTPTSVWKSHPKRPASPFYTPSAPYINHKEEYNPEDDLNDAIKHGHVVGNHGL